MNQPKSYQSQLSELTVRINNGRYDTLERNEKRMLAEEHKRMIAADINEECDNLISCLESVNIGLIGRKGSGKSTIFQELTHGYIIDIYFVRYFVSLQFIF